MDVKECRRLRLLEALAEVPASELSRRTGAGGEAPIAESYISRMRLEPGTNGAKGIGEKSARRIEVALRKPLYWMDSPPSVAGGQPHEPVSKSGAMRFVPVALPLQVTWEAIMSSKKLPSQFMVAMPDQAMQPRVAQGTVLIFSSEETPKVGVGVLVEDGAGARYIRRYAEGAAGTWLAQATNDAYITLDSKAHSLTILAVMTGRMSGDL